MTSNNGNNTGGSCSDNNETTRRRSSTPPTIATMAEEIVAQAQRGQLQLQLPQVANRRTFHFPIPLMLNPEERVINNVVDIIDCVLSLVDPDDFEDEHLTFPDDDSASAYKRQ